MDLGRATQLEGSRGRYRAELPDAWAGPFALYGGFLAAVALRAVAVLDGAFHDPLFAAQGGPSDFAAYPFRLPSADLLVHFHRAAPDSEWLFCRARSDVAEAGLVSGDARLWSQGGKLLASGRGLIACRPRT